MGCLTRLPDDLAQGFPDYFALAASTLGTGQKFNSHVRSDCITDRYTQMGNAVSPLVAAALGRCCIRAASRLYPEDRDQFIIPAPDPEYDEVRCNHHMHACLSIPTSHMLYSQTSSSRCSVSLRFLLLLQVLVWMSELALIYAGEGLDISVLITVSRML